MDSEAEGTDVVYVDAAATRHALYGVALERASQDAKWGKQEHSLTTWITVLGEEVGEAAKEVLEYRQATIYQGDHYSAQDRLRRLRAELLQAAAVAVATVEDLDRRYLER